MSHACLCAYGPHSPVRNPTRMSPDATKSSGPSSTECSGAPTNKAGNDLDSVFENNLAARPEADASEVPKRPRISKMVEVGAEALAGRSVGLSQPKDPSPDTRSRVTGGNISPMSPEGVGGGGINGNGNGLFSEKAAEVPGTRKYTYCTKTQNAAHEK